MLLVFFFFIVRSPTTTKQGRSSGTSSVYKGQIIRYSHFFKQHGFGVVSSTHLRADGTVLELVCGLRLEKKNYSEEQQIVPNLDHPEQLLLRL